MTEIEFLQENTKAVENNMININEALKNALNEVSRVQREHQLEVARHKNTIKSYEEKLKELNHELQMNDTRINSLMSQIHYLNNKEQENPVNKDEEKKKLAKTNIDSQERLKSNFYYLKFIRF